ncbi:hypothetical protein HanXRQr2_Chr06g0257371 [Helianthus annuus]|uniref:Uncharacterized protein n=1 Tax=Helianthus annuus TaxID=4232 RepID=A0A9K3ISQ0_HELAN|nr:hypothetical protein HanXRQr2_Chr06g0257371 [Helianthus annuus]KAJ0915304.1 hypothetical protein HanPSC8_Chr06g0248361 [Helianthus annuus]
MVVCDSSHTVPLCKREASPFLITDLVLNQFQFSSGSSLKQFKRLRVCYLCRAKALNGQDGWK